MTLLLPWTPEYFSAVPFFSLLILIAILPMFAEQWWHSHKNKTIVALIFIIPVVIYLLVEDGRSHGRSTHDLGHEIGEYFSFVVLLAALYSISGGILILGNAGPCSRTNTMFLGAGLVLANLIGTTGSSMILIRPFLRMNRIRTRKIHLPIFFIMTVSNTGGLLTPLGDPPLFLGFLNGVPFFWTLQLFEIWLVMNASLLFIFYLVDRRLLARESSSIRLELVRSAPSWHLSGLKLNGPLLVLLLLVILLHSPGVGQWLGAWLHSGDLTLSRPWGELVILLLIVISLRATPASIRHGNQFSWDPMTEVAILFLAIFITMVPALAILRTHGGQLPLTTAWQYFWATGLLSAFLDNAPTYATLAALASGDKNLAWLSTYKPDMLAAISCGAVFMGSLSYIGNGPNFMVKAVAEKHGYTMPGFFHYIFLALLILVPLLLGVTLLFFV